jgi:hypothetical protein
VVEGALGGASSGMGSAGGWGVELAFRQT